MDQPSLFVTLLDPAKPRSVWLRLLGGLLLAQGLFYGLWQMCSALIGTTVAVEQDFGYFLLRQTMQIIGIVAGSLLVGAGQQRGYVWGGVLGLVNSVLLLMLPFILGQAITPVEWYAVPIVQTVLGIVGSYTGSLIWKPLPVWKPTSAFIGGMPAPLPPIRRQPSPFDGPTYWGRVFVGVLIAVVGSLGASNICAFVLEAGREQFTYQTRNQIEFFTWEIAVVAIFGGAAFAGANTPNGIKQGGIVGIISAAILVGLYLYNGIPPTITLFFDLMRFQVPGMHPALLYFSQTVLCCVGLGLMGGSFGGSLLPPVVPYPRREKYLDIP